MGYGDVEPRVAKRVHGEVLLKKDYRQVRVHVNGHTTPWRGGDGNVNGGHVTVKVNVDLDEQTWGVKVKAKNLYAPLLERLLEIPLDFYSGRADADVHVWGGPQDPFPHLKGEVAVRNLSFQIYDAPSAFTDVNGKLVLDGQQMYIYRAVGNYGAVPLSVSGDLDVNPVGGEYRLSCQVAGVEANALMRALKARPPPYPLAGALKGVVYCRGPLEAPVFEGNAELSASGADLALSIPPSDATQALSTHRSTGAIAAYDKVPIAAASASFTFNTDDCVSAVYGIRLVPLGGGEIRGSGNLWVCPEGELDPAAVSVDCWGQALPTDKLLEWYMPAGMEMPRGSLGPINARINFRHCLLMPTIDIAWDAPRGSGSLNGAFGDVAISRENINLKMTAGLPRGAKDGNRDSDKTTLDLVANIPTTYPPLPRDIEVSDLDQLAMIAGQRPTIEGVDLDLRLRQFDLAGLDSKEALPATTSPSAVHLKVTGKFKVNGRVVRTEVDASANEEAEAEKASELELGARGLAESFVGEVHLADVKINQLLLAPKLSGTLGASQTGFKLETTGRPDENLMIEVMSSPPPLMPSISFTLQRGQLHTHAQLFPGASNLEIRNLPLDELELASLRGTIEKAEVELWHQKRRGQGSLVVRKPRFSGLHGESLDCGFIWKGDVVTLEKSVLEQANSKYELSGEYVLPGSRDRAEDGREGERMAPPAGMAGELGNLISRMGRWRVSLIIPHADVAEMLPAARLLSRSRDPAVLTRSKELFLEGVQNAGFTANNLKQQIEHVRRCKISDLHLEEDVGMVGPVPLPGLAELRGRWWGTISASGGGNGDTMADFNLTGEDWDWGTYKVQKVEAVGEYNNEGLHLEKLFVQKDTATVHADGTLLGPQPNLHFAVLNFPVDLVPALLQALPSSSSSSLSSSTPDGLTAASSSAAALQPQMPLKGILHMEGDLRGTVHKPQIGFKVSLLDGAVGGVSLSRAEIRAATTCASSRLVFLAHLEPATQVGYVRMRGSIPLTADGAEEGEEPPEKRRMRNVTRSSSSTSTSKDRELEPREREKGAEEEGEEKGGGKHEEGQGDEPWLDLAEEFEVLESDDPGALQVDAGVKDGGMTLVAALLPQLNWLHGSADITLQVRGTVTQPVANGVATFHRVAVSSPVLPRPLQQLGGSIRVIDNTLLVDGLEGRVGRRGLLQVRGTLPFRAGSGSSEGIGIRAEGLEVRAKNVFSGQVDSELKLLGSLLEPEVTGDIKLSRGIGYLSQERGPPAPPSASGGGQPQPTELPRAGAGLGGFGWMAAVQGKTSRNPVTAEVVPVLPSSQEAPEEEGEAREAPAVAVRLREVRVNLGPELRLVYPLILNFATSGELELNGFADPLRVRPKGTLHFESGEINLVATQVRLNRDHPNVAKFEPEQGLDPTLDLKLVGADWQLKIQGRAQNWQDNLVITSTRSGEEDALTQTEAARVFESQLAESLLEEDGQLAFTKLAAATVGTLMPRIETKGEFGQARWRLTSAPQIPNLLSLDPTSDPFKSLANLSFGTEVEVQLGKHLQASVVRQLKESDISTQFSLMYQLNSKMRLLFSSISSVENRLLFQFSATD